MFQRRWGWIQHSILAPSLWQDFHGLQQLVNYVTNDGMSSVQQYYFTIGTKRETMKQQNKQSASCGDNCFEGEYEDYFKCDLSN